MKVGQHVAVSPGALPRFLARFAEGYGGLGKVDLLVSAAAAHHRLLWMHPFLDGNGRVARLMSHAMLLGILDTGAVWSAARGLARNVQQYKTLLANCDWTRRNDFDGRGTLSEEALAELTRFFLTVCIDQVDFMESLFQPTACGRAFWSGLKKKSGRVNCHAVGAGAGGDPPSRRAAARRGGRDRRHGGKAGTPDSSRAAPKGVLASEGASAPLHLAFPANLAQRWMPGLFPERPST